MNTEKAIKLLREMQEAWKLQITGDAFDALEMAITALENNSNEQLNDSTATQFNAIKTHVKGLTACRVPEDDTISRADVEQTVEDNILCYTHSDRPIDQDPDTECHMAIRTALRMLRKDLRKLPSVQPDLQPTCNQLATDCINRQAAINTVVFECGEWTGLAKEISKQLRQMPSAQPEPERTMEEFIYGQDMGNPEDGSL